MSFFKQVMGLLMVLFVVSGCAQAPVTEDTSMIQLQITSPEKVEVSVEKVTQPNCGGTAEVENEVQRSRSIEHIVETRNGMSVNAKGQVGFAGTDIELGAAIAQEFGVSYGVLDNLTRSLSVKAKPGTDMEHQIRQSEIWQVGVATVHVGGEETSIPFRFRQDFAIELISSKDLGDCGLNNPVTPPDSEKLTCADVGGKELLDPAWHLEGQNGDAQAYQEIDPNALQGKDTLLVTYDLHGLSAQEGERKDASAIIFDQPNWFVVSLANYGKNGIDGMQTVLIPLSDFIGLPDIPSSIPGGGTLDMNAPVGTLHTRFWSKDSFVVDITSICAYRSGS